MTRRIAVIDYGSGNLRSVVKVINYLGYEATVATRGSDLAGVTHMILPGVGAFDPAMAELNRRPGLRAGLEELVRSKRALVLGLCLGMQILVQDSEEGQSQGLGLVPGHCRAFPKSESLKVPHMGWNSARAFKDHPILGSKISDWRFYFVHSYYVDVTNPADILMTTEHIIPFTSAFARENIYGVQFHPEKSHRFGFELIGNFCALDTPT